MQEIGHQTIQQIQDGNTRLFGQVVRNYERPVRGFVYRLLHGGGLAGEAEDATQEIFLKAYTKLSTYDTTQGKFSSWLFAIARNHCLSMLRKRRPRVYSLNDEDGLQPAAPDATPREALERSQTRQAIITAIDGLPEELKTPILLFHYEGMGYPAIAQALGIPVGTVKSRIFRGREQLCDRLKSLRMEAKHE